MAELTFDPKEITEALRRHVKDFKPEVGREEVGRVEQTGDGIARVRGLPGVMANELLEFPGGELGVAFNLEAIHIGVVVLGSAEEVEEGSAVKRTGRILSVGV